MRFMIIVKSCPAFEAEITPEAPEELMAEMAAYHEELARAGVLLDGSGLHPSHTGWRVHYGPEGKRIVDGPFKNFEGKISHVDQERGRIKTLVSMFGRETPVELDALQVKKI